MKNFTKVNQLLRKYFSPPVASQKGFTLVEVLLVMAIFALMAGLATVNLFNYQQQSQMDATVNAFIADMKDQQVKAMSGDTSGGASVENYGVSFDPTNFRYILFKGTYSASNADNFAVSVPQTIEVTTTFSNSQLIFEKGSGEIEPYSSTNASITFRDTTNNDQTVIQLNKYGVITGIN